MDLIYLYEGEFGHGDKGHDLIKNAAAAYADEMGIEFDIDSCEIIREDKGKPYFVNIPIEFSLTHTGKLWMCMFSQSPCGLDLQIQKDCEYGKIAKHIYTENEAHYVELWGIDGFFDIWTHKEAFVKLTGQGLFTEMPSTVDDNFDIVKSVQWKDRVYHFQKINIDESIKCAVCTENESIIEMRVIG